MKTIEDIQVERTFYKREKDNYGTVQRIPYTKFVKRNVEVVASGTRFGYWWIDLIILLVLQFAVGILFALMDFKGFQAQDASQAISFLFFFGYYFLLEHYAGGTVGKLATGYVVINEFAQPISMREAVLRTLSRMIPFEAFSCFSDRGWHDKFSKTYVVKKSEREKLQQLLNDGISLDPDRLD
jgi:uncharacterized RDD family membrane protein YckC